MCAQDKRHFDIGRARWPGYKIDLARKAAAFTAQQVPTVFHCAHDAGGRHDRHMIFRQQAGGRMHALTGQQHQCAVLGQRAKHAGDAHFVVAMAGLNPVSPKTLGALTDYATGGSWTPARAAGLLNLLLLSPEFLAN